MDSVKIVKRDRKLVDEADVFSQNAWDDTVWTDEMFQEAANRVEQQRLAANSQFEAGSLSDKVLQVENCVGNKWDQFYEAHGDKFFKDRKWIFSEFPEILARLRDGSGECNILEIGCGVGNAVSHIIETNTNPLLQIFCCDISSNAIDTLKERRFYLNNAEHIDAFHADICSNFDIIADKIPKGSLDFITAIFTISALKPELIAPAIERLVSLMKPGGMFLFRDYAQYDLAQLRFKGQAYLSTNYYVRADGTTSYFFTNDFVDNVFSSAGLKKVSLKNDNRMLVNRSRSLKMCRRWIQAKYKRPG